jgi:hypothetical protein
MILAHRLLAPMIGDVSSSSVATGFAHMFNNKGGAGISFNIAQRSFLFVGVHLPAGQKKIRKRCSAYRRIE